MSYFGETIRKAREAKGMTTSQVAEKTHILVQIINAMEREDFSMIKAGIYGRGFVKLICECVGISDPKPLVAEFMDIYEGRRPPVVQDSFQPNPQARLSVPRPAPAAPPATGPIVPPASEPVAPPAPDLFAPSAPDPVAPPMPEPIPQPAPEPIAPPEPEPIAASAPEPIAQPAPEPVAPPAPEPVAESVKGLDLFDPPAPTVEPPPQTRAQEIFSSAYEPPEESSEKGSSAADKFRVGLSAVSHGVLGSVRNIPRSAWRMAVLIIGALAVIALLAWGCIVLYRVTEHPIVPDNTSTVQPAQPEPSPAQPAAKPSKPTAQTAKPTPQATKPKATQSAKPPAQTTKPSAKSTGKPTGKPAAPAKPSGKAKLRSTGQKVPPLYVD